jgi:hypothetical protein
MIPQRAFSDDTQVQEFISFLRTKLGRSFRGKGINLPQGS